MKRVFTSLAILAGTIWLAPAPVHADGVTPMVTLTGNKTGFLIKRSINGNTTIALELALDKDTTVLCVLTDPALLKVFEEEAAKRSKEFEKRSQEINKQLDEALKKNDLKKADELTDELIKNTDEFTRTPAVAEGTLTFQDKRWRLAGTLRPFDPKGKDKGVKFGTCTVQGEAVSGEFKAGKVKSALAVRAGDLTVVLTGPAVKDAVKGGVRARGTLHLGRSGEAVLEATQLAPVKK
jgi:hypothetical protein